MFYFEGEHDCCYIISEGKSVSQLVGVYRISRTPDECLTGFWDAKLGRNRESFVDKLLDSETESTFFHQS